MRSPKDFFRPLAVGAPEPVREIPFRPSRMIHFFPGSNAEDGRQGPRHRPHGRHPPRQPRGRRAGQPTRRPPAPGWSRSARRRRRRHPALDPRQLARLAVGPRRPRHRRHRGRRQARRHHDPEGRGRRGHPLRRPPPRPARGQGRPRPSRCSCTPSSRRRAAWPTSRRSARASPRMQGLSPRPGRPGRQPPHEDHPRRRRSPRLPRAPGPGRRRHRRRPHHLPAGPLALHDRPHGRRLRGQRDLRLLRPVRRHQGHRRLRGPVPQRLPARLRRRLEPPPRADRHRQAGVLARPRRRRATPAR